VGQETVQELGILEYGVVDMRALYSALTFAIRAAHFRDMLPGTV